MHIKVILQLLVFALVLTIFTTHQAWGEEDCYEEKRSIIKYCIKSIRIRGKYVPPSRTCRVYVELCDMACVCHVLTPQDELRISAFKLVRLARDYGVPVPAGSKCGSWTVPPSLPLPRTYP
uniref:Bifunctional inhibitor/plant lipid transfer protein/seed storage helical domain-containing protein n=1 Tax=Setaria viridis TaxID=4556 RepID=A0A4U6TX31_SETVI|nr:hypothetical protein SEVIR_7G230100v2 [Setaria viridis]